jgi:hypothetical protein
MFGGSVQVRDGHVIGKGFGVWTEAKRGLPFGHWLEIRTELTDHFDTVVSFTYGRRIGLEEHPNYYVLEPHLTTGGGGRILEAKVTPDATAREIERAFDFRLSCVSGLVGCSEPSDVLPTAWADYVASRQSRHCEDAGNYGPCALRSLARLARDMDNVLLVEVKRIFPIDSDQNGSQDVEFRLAEILKGQPDKDLARFPMEIGGGLDGSAPLPVCLPPRIFSPGKRIVLFRTESESQSELLFIPYPHCEVVPATEENLGVVRQTLTQLSLGAPTSALREGN